MRIAPIAIGAGVVLATTMLATACMTPFTKPTDIFIDVPTMTIAAPPATTSGLAPVVTPTLNLETPNETAQTPDITPLSTERPVEYPVDIPQSLRLDWKYMPREGEQFALGQAFELQATITSDTPITSVRVVITNERGDVEIDQSAESSDLNKSTYTMFGYNSSISTKAPFSKLTLGKKKLRLICSTQSESNVVLWEANINVSEWVKLTDSEIHGIFVDDLRSFFENDDYLFSYKVTTRAKRGITIDPEWMEKYITSVAFNGRHFSVNKLAYEKYVNAFNHVKNSYVYFEYNNGSSGVFCLNDIQEYNLADGAFVPRFQDMSMSVISHHSFGTAIDLNCTLEVNKIRIDDNGNDQSWNEIEAAISKLSYEGLRTVNGRDNVYCFKFNGNKPTGTRAVPDALVNYLWHELAFAREGFAWGGYFGNGSDAMHFSLTEPNDFGTVYPDGSTATPDHQRVQLVFDYAP